ncbi:unnamed protein product [Ixodes pacificus]
MRCSLAATLFVYCLSVAAAERLSGAGTLLAVNPAGRASLGSRDVGGVRGVP